LGTGEEHRVDSQKNGHPGRNFNTAGPSISGGVVFEESLGNAPSIGGGVYAFGL